MAITVPPPQPYRLDWTGASDLDALNAHLATICANADEMFQQLYERPTIAIDDSDTSSSSSSSSGVSSVVNDTNVTGSIAGTALTLGWTGTLAAARLNANVVQSIVNDTNVTGSIAAQVLTLAWTGTLGVARGGTALASYTAGDLLYASNTTVISKLAKGTATQLLHSGTTPTWSAVSLSADVSGNLPVANLNSGTGASATTFWCGDGTWKAATTGGGASIGSDALTVSRSGPSGNYNLSTLGTIDWFAPNGITAAHYRNQALNAIHAKQLGFGLYCGFDWITTGSPSVFSQVTGALTFTTSTGDDMNSSPVSAVTGAQGVFTTAGSQYGWKLFVPARNKTGKLFIATESFSCNTQLTVKLYGQTETSDTSVTTSRTSGAGGADLFEIDFTAPVGGTLVVTQVATTIQGTNQGANVKFIFAYLTT